MKSTASRDKLIAIIATAVVAVVVIVMLLLCSLSWDKESLTTQNEQKEKEEEEIFFEMELVELGEPDSKADNSPASSPLGEPEFSEDPDDELVTPGENLEPTPPTEKIVTQTAPSPVQSVEPSLTEKEKSKISSDMAKGFSSKNGKPDGKNDSAGSGGTGAGVKGSIDGRTLKSCPTPRVKLERKVVVVVKITVDENGDVTEASFKSGTSDSKIKQACVDAARGAKWTASKGKFRQTGTITFTIIPT